MEGNKVSENSPPVLKTERLVLRPLDLSDAKDVQRLAGDRRVAENVTLIPHPYEDGMAEEWINTLQPEFEAGTLCNFAIEDSQTGVLVGVIGLKLNSQFNHAEMGYWIGVPFWNQGFCTEAAEKVLEFAFRELKLFRVYAHHITRNPASGRVMKKLGMSHEGLQRKHVEVMDQYEDIELYGILAEEYLNNH